MGSPKTVIIDYGVGNLGSVKNAMDHLGWESYLSNDADKIKEADAIILPGVGAFGMGIQNLHSMNLIPVLEEQVLKRKKPFLGICLGMQLLASRSEEHGFHEGLGWIEGVVKRIELSGNLRLPHMGWNNVDIKQQSPLFKSLGEDRNFYFVHSYFLQCDDRWVETTCSYGREITASIRKDNIFAVQFHPEKSHENGLMVLKNFMNFVEAATC